MNAYFMGVRSVEDHNTAAAAEALRDGAASYCGSVTSAATAAAKATGSAYPASQVDAAIPVATTSTAQNAALHCANVCAVGGRGCAATAAKISSV
jgi:hypothetical protein